MSFSPEVEIKASSKTHSVKCKVRRISRKDFQRMMPGGMRLEALKKEGVADTDPRVIEEVMALVDIGAPLLPGYVVEGTYEGPVPMAVLVEQAAFFELTTTLVMELFGTANISSENAEGNSVGLSVG